MLVSVAIIQAGTGNFKMYINETFKIQIYREFHNSAHNNIEWLTSFKNVHKLYKFMTVKIDLIKKLSCSK